MAPEKRRGYRLWKYWLALALLIATGMSSPAQKPPRQDNFQAKKVQLPYMEGNVLKAIFHGENSQPVLGGKNLIFTDNFRLETFANGDQTKLDAIIQGPRCVLNTANHNVSSEGPITITTVSTKPYGLVITNMIVTGIGFATLETNSLLIISNSVRTVVYAKEKEVPNRDVFFGPWLQDTNPPLVVTSDYLRYLLQGKLAAFRGHVRATQSPFGLECALMDVQMGTNNSPTTIVADQEVVITDERDQGHATGSRATYDTQAGILRLVGQPHWEDNLGRQAWAREFVYDRGEGVIHLNDKARTLVPGKVAGLGNSGLPGDTGNSKGSTNSVFDIHADQIQFQVGGQDNASRAGAASPSRRFEAHHHVVMTNQVEQTWATGEDAVFSQDTGQLQLTGNAVWILREDRVEGDLIEANQKTRMLHARPNAVVTVPSRVFKNESKSPVKGAKPPPVARGIVQIHSEDFLWQNNVATFAGRVHGVQTEDEETAAILDCQNLRLTFDETNRIRRLAASGDVRGQEYPTASRASSGRLNCEKLDVAWYPGGQLLQRVEAEKNVLVDQTILNASPKPVVYRRGKAEALWVNFSSVTNQVESALAQTNVLILEIDSDRVSKGPLTPKAERGATCGRADYLAEPRGRGLTMTGSPLAWMVRTNMAKRTNSIYVITNATSLTWSPATSRFHGTGPYEMLSTTNRIAY